MSWEKWWNSRSIFSKTSILVFGAITCATYAAYAIITAIVSEKAGELLCISVAGSFSCGIIQAIVMLVVQTLLPVLFLGLPVALLVGCVMMLMRRYR